MNDIPLWVRTMGHVKDYIRQPYAWPGGYPKVLYQSDGEVLCVKCARNTFPLIVDATMRGLNNGWRASGVDVYFEGPPLCCCNCSAWVESAYGDPNV